MNQADYPSEEEIERAANVIKRLPRGYMPYPLFMALASRIVTPTLELVILRQFDEGIQVLLTKRPDDDEHWPGQWHVPGTVVRSTDTEATFRSCFSRILEDELGGLVTISQPSRVSIEFWDVERGRELDQLFAADFVEGKELPSDTRFFSLDALPTNLMRHHHDVIDIVMQAQR